MSKKSTAKRAQKLLRAVLQNLPTIISVVQLIAELTK